MPLLFDNTFLAQTQMNLANYFCISVFAVILPLITANAPLSPQFSVCWYNWMRESCHSIAAVVAIEGRIVAGSKVDEGIIQ